MGRILHGVVILWISLDGSLGIEVKDMEFISNLKKRTQLYTATIIIAAFSLLGSHKHVKTLT